MLVVLVKAGFRLSFRVDKGKLTRQLEFMVVRVVFTLASSSVIQLPEISICPDNQTVAESLFEVTLLLSSTFDVVELH